MPRKPYQAASVAEPFRLALAPDIDDRDGLLLKGGRLVNCYAEKNPLTNGYDIRRRPCIGNINYAPTLVGGVKGQGIFQWVSQGFTGMVYVFGTNSASDVYVGAAYVGTITGTLSYFRFTPVRASVPSLVINDGRSAWVLQFVTPNLTLTQITDVDFPLAGFCPGMPYLDGTLYAMDFFGNIYGSAIDDPFTYSALNVIVARSLPGVGVALVRQGNYIIALKSASVEIFYDTGNPPPGSPLSPVPGATKEYGCIDPSTLAGCQGTLVWVTFSQEGVGKVIRMDDLGVQIVSTPGVERWLSLAIMSGPSILTGSVYSFCFQRGGHRFYVLTSEVVNQTLVYDIDEGKWYQWTNWGTSPTAWPWVSSTYSTGGASKLLLQGRVGGIVAECDTDGKFSTDFNSPVYADIYTPNFDGGVDRRKTLAKLRFDVDRRANSTLHIRHNDNDYDPTSWSDYRDVSLDQIRPFLNNEGSFYRRAYHLRHYDPVPFRISAADLQIDIGTL